MQKKAAESKGTGGLVISEEVIATIAVNAAKDVDGVAAVASRAPEMLSTILKTDSPLRSVKVTAVDNDIQLHVYIAIKDGKKIPAVASEVQRSVKDAVQSMTGKVVTKVNVNIADIDFADSAAAGTQ